MNSTTVNRYCLVPIAENNRIIVMLFLIFLALLTGCAQAPTDSRTSEALYLTPQPASVQLRNTPVFLIKEFEKQYNRIGMPSVRELADQKTEVYVDANKPAIFFEKQEFTTPKGTYQNLLYRIHFEQVPFGFGKFNITAGKNPGILIIYTLDSSGQLLLVTTVHTCGCFLAFFPTNSLPMESFPTNWQTDSQFIYGYTLPSLLQPFATHDPERIVFTLESETHRISDVTLLKHDLLQHSLDAIDMKIFKMNDLYQLPYKDRTESFFEMDGARKGYVRNNTKFLERLLISWWAFDLYVGQDKAYGAADNSDTIFYTSLKFWDRKASDLKDFPRFLSYWGWKL